MGVEHTDFRSTLGVIGAGTACLKFAVFTFVDEPVRAAVAHVTNPLNQCTL